MMASERTSHQRTDQAAKSQWKYFLWAVPVSIILLWPLTRSGGVSIVAVVPVAAFSLGMVASLLSAPLFQRGGRVRMLCFVAGMLSGLMGVGLCLLAVIYFHSIALVIASAASGAIGIGLAAWNIRVRDTAPDQPNWLAAMAVLNVLLVLAPGYVMLSAWWNG